MRKGMLGVAGLAAALLAVPAAAQDDGADLVINVGWPPEDALVLGHVERRLGDARLVGPDPGRAYLVRVDRVASDKTGLIGETFVLQSSCSDTACGTESWTPERGKQTWMKLRLDRKSRSFFRLRGW